jgi:hypothetical protein
LPTVAELAQQELNKRRVQQVSAFQSSYNPFNPNFRATVGSKLRELIDDSGIGGGYRQGLINAGEGIETAIDFTPIVGDAVGIGDVRTSYNQGDMVGTGINAAAAAVGALPIVGDVAAKGVKSVGSALRTIDAYHGSPHEFEQFSMDKIGTGKGQQVYGHGIYFSENPEIARPFSERTFKVNQSLMPSVVNFFENNYPISKAKAEMKAAHPNATDTEIDNALNEYYMHLDDQGYMYNANLNVGPEDLLDFDAPLSQQPEAVKKAAEAYNVKTSPSGMKEARGSDVYRAIAQSRQQPPFDNTSMNAGGPEASAYLNELGIKGIKYKARGEGVNNYVIFDDSLIDTKRVNDQLTPSWMNPEARMQRAQDLGFDTSRVSYRGLSGEYDPNKAGNYQMFTSSPEDAGEYGSSVVPAYLNKGSNLVVEGGRNNFNSIPVSNLPAEVKANLHSSVGDVARTDDIAYAAQLAGYDSVTINNVFDKASNEIPLKPLPASNEPMSQEMIDILDEVNASGMLNNTPDVALPPEIPRDYEPATIDIIFDPKNIRSIEAEFDPAKADSADLLSSVGATSALRGIV